MDERKNVLEMGSVEFATSKKKKLLTEEEIILWKTSARQNIFGFPREENVFICDAISLIPKKKYKVFVECISMPSDLEMCVVIEIAHGKGTIEARDQVGKAMDFFFEDDYISEGCLIKSIFGKIIVYYGQKAFDYRGVNKYTRYMWNCMGMKIEEISETERIYHCTREAIGGVQPDFETFVFSVKWELAE